MEFCQDHVNLKKALPEVAFTSFDNFVQYVALWLLMQQWHWSTPWFQATWTTATVFSVASVKPIFVHSSQYRMRQHDSSLARESLTVLPAPCAMTSIFCQWDNVSCSNCVRWPVNVFVALHHHTWAICAFRYQRRPLTPGYGLHLMMHQTIGLTGYIRPLSLALVH